MKVTQQFNECGGRGNWCVISTVTVHAQLLVVCAVELHTSASCINYQLCGLTQQMQCHIVQPLPAILCHLTDPPGAGLERVLSVTLLQRTLVCYELQ